MDEEFIEPLAQRKQPFVLFRLWQWVVAGFVALMALLLLSDSSKASLPGASPLLYWSTLAVAAVAAIALSTPVFFRVPKRAKLAAYIGLLLSFGLVVAALNNVNEAYWRTPQGKSEHEAQLALEARVAAEERRARAQQAAAQVRERAEQAASQAREQAKRAAAEAREHAQQAAVAAEQEAQQEAAKAIAKCQALVPAVIEMREERGPKVIEINNVRRDIYEGAPFDGGCGGDAITESGAGFIRFHVETTPQGNQLLNSSFPLGLK